MKQLQNLAPNIFDVFAIAMIIIGMWRGKVRGMSEEILDVLQMLVMVVAAGFGYKVVADVILKVANLPPLFAYLISYLLLLVVVKLVFMGVKRAVGEKIVGSDVFGRFEFHLGTIAGAARFASILIILLALLNARQYSAQQVAAAKKANEEAFGSIGVPSIAGLQETVFKESVVGPLVKKHLSAQLITPTFYDGSAAKREGHGKKMEKAVDETIDTKK